MLPILVFSCLGDTNGDLLGVLGSVVLEAYFLGICLACFAQRATRSDAETNSPIARGMEEKASHICIGIGIGRTIFVCVCVVLGIEIALMKMEMVLCFI